MALTPLSKELKKIRIDWEISRAKMAKDLKISDKSLALIEAGKSEVTDSFIQSLVKIYANINSLTDECDIDIAEEELLHRLEVALILSVESITFDMGKLNYRQKSDVLWLRKKFYLEEVVRLEDIENTKKEEREAKIAERIAKKAAEEVVVILPTLKRENYEEHIDIAA